MDVTLWALKEARAGFYPAALAIEQIGAAFKESLRGERPSEYPGIVAWAVAQAKAADLDEVLRVADRDRYLPEPLSKELAADPVLAAEVNKTQRQRRARQIADEIEVLRHPKPVPDAALLGELLARPVSTQWRIEDLLPAAGRMTLVSQRKLGKTTMTGNLAHALLTGEPFLDRFAVEKLTGRIVALNYEVTGEQYGAWMDEIGVPHDRLFVVNLRGRRNLLADEAGRGELAELILAQDGEVLFVDPFGRAYTGKSQYDPAEVTPWLVRLDELAEQAGVRELVMTVHAGWDGERTRGSTALEDWPDSIVTMTRDPDTAERFLRAEGRDVDLDEDRLDYDPETRRLRLSGAGSRQQVRQTAHGEHLADVVEEIVTAQPGVTVPSDDDWSTEPEKYRVGQSLRILYDPANPQDARLNTATGRWGRVIVPQPGAWASSSSRRLSI